MKRTGVVSLLLAASLMAVSCGQTEETEPSATTSQETYQEQLTIISPETEETAEEAEPTGPVELTVDNFFETDPAISEYGMSGNCGDIIDLVNLDYLNQDLDEVFVVDSIEDLASVTYLVNAYPRIDEDGDGELDIPFIKIDLVNDIDLTGYNWVPMGTYVDYDTDCMSFTGIFAGNGHTIAGLTINNGDDMAGFFGQIIYSTVIGLNVQDATVGGVFSGIISGYNGATNFIDCHASGALPDNFDEGAATFNAHTSMSSNRFIDCSVSVVNASGDLCEETFTVNQYDEGAGNALYEMFDPERDGIYDYTQDYFFER